MQNTQQSLSSKAISEFRAIYRDEFGQELSDAEVREIAMRLLRFFGILIGVSGDQTPSNPPEPR